jgi:hypothetical protein
LKCGGPKGVGAFLLKKQGRDKIKSTGTARKVPKTVKTAEKLLLVNG